jgi:hypothetical protein
VLSIFSKFGSEAAVWGYTDHCFVTLKRYGFFSDVTPRMPTDEEIDGLVNNTARFYDDIFNAEYPFEFENFQFQRTLHVYFKVFFSGI